jgi:hypothetical protein
MLGWPSTPPPIAPSEEQLPSSPPPPPSPLATSPLPPSPPLEEPLPQEEPLALEEPLPLVEKPLPQLTWSAPSNGLAARLAARTRESGVALVALRERLLSEERLLRGRAQEVWRGSSGVLEKSLHLGALLAAAAAVL